MGYAPSGNISLLRNGETIEGLVSGQAFGPLQTYDEIRKSETKQEIGELALESDGSFSVVVPQEKKVMLVTDAGGSIPVFYGHGPNGFALGTLVHHVAALAGLSSVDLASAADYLLNGAICYPYSWYEQVREAPPGSVSSFDLDGDVRSHTYWQPTEPDAPRRPCDAEEWGRRLRAQVKNAVKLGIEGKSHGRISYSGGIDSRAVLSVVPDSFECVPTIVLNSKNKEYWAAKHSARLLGRKIELITRPEDHYQTAIRKRIDLIGPGWDFRHAHMVGPVAESMGDADVLLGGFLVDGLFKSWGISNVRSRGLRPNRLTDPSSGSRFDAEGMVQPSIWNEHAAEALTRRKRHHERLRNLRSKTANNWQGLYPLSNDPHYTHYLTNLRIGPATLEPFAFSQTYRLGAKMPETGRIENTVLRHAFSRDMGLAAWCPTSRGVTPRLGDQYLGYILGFAVRRWFDFRGKYLDPEFQSGSWPSNQQGWHPVRPENHFSKEECHCLRQRISRLLSEKYGPKIFQNESILGATKVQSLALAFDEGRVK